MPRFDSLTIVVTLVSCLSLALCSELAEAQEARATTPPIAGANPEAAPADTARAATRAPAPRSPYSLPFQLRPVTAATVVRSDSSFAFYENATGQHGFAVVSGLLGAFRIPGTGDKPGTGLVPLVKFTVVNDSPPGTAVGGFAFVNPLVGASYALAFGSGWRASGFLGLTIPIGMGGGDTPDKGALDARNVGPVARVDMENVLFAGQRPRGYSWVGPRLRLARLYGASRGDSVPARTRSRGGFAA